MQSTSSIPYLGRSKLIRYELQQSRWEASALPRHRRVRVELVEERPALLGALRHAGVDLGEEVLQHDLASSSYSTKSQIMSLELVDTFGILHCISPSDGGPWRRKCFLLKLNLNDYTVSTQTPRLSIFIAEGVFVETLDLPTKN